MLRLCIKRKNGERGLLEIEESFTVELKSVGHYDANNDRKYLKVVARAKGLKRENIENKEDCNYKEYFRRKWKKFKA